MSDCSQSPCCHFSGDVRHGCIVYFCLIVDAGFFNMYLMYILVLAEN
jgi:hypothetical protein